MRIQVETHETLRDPEQVHRLQFNGRGVEIVETADQWAGPDYRYFKVRDTDGNLYIVRHDEPRNEWELTMFERPNVPAHGMGQEVRGRLQ
jgi:hypothetical protein